MESLSSAGAPALQNGHNDVDSEQPISLNSRSSSLLRRITRIVFRTQRIPRTKRSILLVDHDAISKHSKARLEKKKQIWMIQRINSRFHIIYQLSCINGNFSNEILTLLLVI